jgi:hypothetical protein
MSPPRRRGSPEPDGRTQGPNRVAQAHGAPSAGLLDNGDREWIDDQVAGDRRAGLFKTSLALGIVRKNRRRFKALDPIASRVQIDNGPVGETVRRNNLQHAALNSEKSR